MSTILRWSTKKNRSSDDVITLIQGKGQNVFIIRDLPYKDPPRNLVGDWKYEYDLNFRRRIDISDRVTPLKEQKMLN